MQPVDLKIWPAFTCIMNQLHVCGPHTTSTPHDNAHPLLHAAPLQKPVLEPIVEVITPCSQCPCEDNYRILEMDEQDSPMIVSAQCPYMRSKQQLDYHTTQQFERGGPKIPRFDGKDSSQFLPWLRQFQAIARANEWEDNETMA